MKKIFSCINDTAEQFGIKVTFISTTTLEGYEAWRFVINVPSHAIADDFINKITPQTALEHWQEVVLEADPAIVLCLSQFPTNISPFEVLDPGIIGPWIDGNYNHAFLNEKLRQSREGHEPLFWACDWIVPAELQADWLYKIQSTQWYHGPYGSELRFLNWIQPNQNQFAVQLMVRLYKQSELEEFAAELKKHLMNIDNWYRVTAQYFSRGLAFNKNRFPSQLMEERLSHLVEEASCLNAQQIKS